ncbi:S1/P1 nuclease [Jiella sp. KSK16Y-1]|uniref:S1/P1 nuclease n=2 Tax=Jiella mangrovi TaxID=2821407 RepID=A0ABS4BBX7_9HYPH|nr:S1/P1 nuclease [Jiella mangrovi]MBP0614253.1 S1/P1 nuclease [Jiella mangrovi]
MPRRLTALFAAAAFLCPGSAMAWWDGGHMQIAAVAYDRLSTDIRVKVDALIRLNPDYERWVAGVRGDLAAQHAFVRASVWADDIKSDSAYTRSGDRPDGRHADRNAGYYDHLVHDYWHYRDVGFSPDGTAVDDPDPVNALTQIKLLTEGLSEASGLPDGVRSYDLVWLLHLVGDAHQPLHATARFTAVDSNGDRGGNDVDVIDATGVTMSLHAYWDSRFGGYVTPQGAIRDGLSDQRTKLPEPDAARATIADPEQWFAESRDFAMQFAYAAPVGPAKGPYKLDREYETKARDVSREQAAVAGARLANLITAALK